MQNAGNKPKPVGAEMSLYVQVFPKTMGRKLECCAWVAAKTRTV